MPCYRACSYGGEVLRWWCGLRGAQIATPLPRPPSRTQPPPTAAPANPAPGRVRQRRQPPTAPRRARMRKGSPGPGSWQVGGGGVGWVLGSLRCWRGAPTGRRIAGWWCAARAGAGPRLRGSGTQIRTRSPAPRCRRPAGQAGHPAGSHRLLPPGRVCAPAGRRRRCLCRFGQQQRPAGLCGRPQRRVHQQGVCFREGNTWQEGGGL